MKRSRSSNPQFPPSKRPLLGSCPSLNLLWLHSRLPVYQKLRLDLIRTICERLRPVVLFHFEQDKLVVWEWKRKELEVVAFGERYGKYGGKVCSIGRSLLHIGGYAESKVVTEIHFPAYSLTLTSPMLLRSSVPSHSDLAVPP